MTLAVVDAFEKISLMHNSLYLDAEKISRIRELRFGACFIYSVFILLTAEKVPRVYKVFKY
jgi:hypothetical protein